MKISAVVITKNEAANIAGCLGSLKFCDETVVVDSESQDATREIARQYTDKVFQEKWQGFTAQKKLAVSKASNDWVISIDADEQVPSSLAQEILKKIAIAENIGYVAFSVPRKTIYSGQWIRFGGWYPNRLVRVFRKSKGEWKGGELHEYWEAQGKVGLLEEALLHYSFDSFEDQVQRNNLYSTLGAEKLYNAKTKFSWAALVFKPLAKFLETYVFKLGFLDGFRGFFIAVSAAYSVFLKWAKLWELNGKKT